MLEVSRSKIGIHASSHACVVFVAEVFFPWPFFLAASRVTPSRKFFSKDGDYCYTPTVYIDISIIYHQYQMAVAHTSLGNGDSPLILPQANRK